MYLLLQTSISVPHSKSKNHGSKSAMPIPSLPAKADLQKIDMGE
jgi:hypothetical protein